MAILVNLSIFDTARALNRYRYFPGLSFVLRMTLDRCFEMVVNNNGADIEEHLTAGCYKLEETRIGPGRM